MPDFRGMQALGAWLVGHDHGLLLQGPDPDCPDPLLHGVVVKQKPQPHTRVRRWDPVTVWVQPPEGGSGVREPRRPLPPVRSESGYLDQEAAQIGHGGDHLDHGGHPPTYLRGL